MLKLFPVTVTKVPPIEVQVFGVTVVMDSTALAGKVVRPITKVTEVSRTASLETRFLVANRGSRYLSICLNTFLDYH